jgi:hypothetical protein
LKKPPSNPSAGISRADTSSISAWRSGGSADGNSKRSKLFVPSYFCESVIPTVTTRPS